MKFTVNRKELLEALTLTGRAINKSIVPAIMGYRFNINQSKLTVTGGNMEIYIHNTIDIVSTIDKLLIVPKDKIYNLLRELNDPSLEFEITSTSTQIVTEKIEVLRLVITSQSGKYNIPVEKGDDYPSFPVREAISFNVKSTDLENGIDKTLFACASDDLKPSLTAIYLNVSNGKAVYVAANGAVLSSQPIGTPEVGDSQEFLLPKSSAAIVKDLPKDDEVRIEANDSSITFHLFDGLIFQSLLVDDKFPSYKPNIQVKNDKHLHIDRSLLMSSIKRVTMFSSERQNYGIAFKFSENTLQVLINNNEDGAAIETLPATYQGEPITVGFNGKTLLTALDKVDGEVVYFDFTNEKLGVLLHNGNIDLKEKENFILIMPVLLHETLLKVS